MTRDRTRVVFLCGGLPADPHHLQAAAEHVDLTVYRSGWSHSVAADPHRAPPAGVAVRTFEPIVRSRRGTLAYAYRGLSRALDRDRPEVIHVVSEPWGLLAVQAANWRRARPASRLILHGCDTLWHHGHPVKKLVRRALIHRSLPVTDAWVAENSTALARARTGGLPRSAVLARIHTNPRNGAMFRLPSDAERAAARAAFGIPVNVPAIGLVGRLVPAKGVELFLDAAESLLRQGFAGRFLVAGAGPLAGEAERRSTDRITFVGGLRHPDGVLELLRALDVIACPSLTTPTWEDQGPRAVLEAMMCGCVPMGTPTGGIPEMLDGRGAVAASTEIDDVAAALAAAAVMSGDPARRADLARWASSTYSTEAVAGRLVELWREVAARESVRVDDGALP